MRISDLDALDLDCTAMRSVRGGLQDIHFTKSTDKSSPRLFSATSATLVTVDSVSIVDSLGRRAPDNSFGSLVVTGSK